MFGNGSNSIESNANVSSSITENVLRYLYEIIYFKYI